VAWVAIAIAKGVELAQPGYFVPVKTHVPPEPVELDPVMVSVRVPLLMEPAIPNEMLFPHKSCSVQEPDIELPLVYKSHVLFLMHEPLPTEPGVVTMLPLPAENVM
jgi:hypothetical protein